MEHLDPIPPFEAPTGWPDYHATFSIQLCELMDANVIDFTKAPFNLHRYSDEQFERVINLLKEHYYYRELNVLPVRRWMREFNRRWNEVAPKYDYLYKALEDGASPLNILDEFDKGRDVFSEFPQTMLSDNEDYASHGTDYEHEKVTVGDFTDASVKVRDRWDTPDKMLIDEMEPLFVHLVTANYNGY